MKDEGEAARFFHPSSLSLHPLSCVVRLSSLLSLLVSIAPTRLESKRLRLDDSSHRLAIRRIA